VAGRYPRAGQNQAQMLRDAREEIQGASHHDLADSGERNA
jgi:hypothetical protein